MSDKRKYKDEEIREIFDLAVSGDDLDWDPLQDQGGLTLDELKEIGREIGVTPARIAEAADALELKRDVRHRGTSLGVPISVTRLVELPGPVSDREWDLLVTEFRETLGVRGHIMSQGGVRQWTADDFQAFLEPTDTGHRLRLMTHKGGAKLVTVLGLAALAVGLIMLMLIVMGTSPVAIELSMLLAMGMGGTALASNALTLPRWARQREGQLEYIADRARALLNNRSSSKGPLLA